MPVCISVGCVRIGMGFMRGPGRQSAYRGGSGSGATRMTNPRVVICDPTSRHSNGTLSDYARDIDSRSEISAQALRAGPILRNDLGARVQHTYGSNFMRHGTVCGCLSRYRG